MFKLQLQLVPFYARITATLNRYFPDVGHLVCTAVLEEFNQLVRQKDATSRTLEPRLRNVRYIVELVKFRIMEAGDALFVSCSLASKSKLNGERVSPGGNVFMHVAHVLFPAQPYPHGLLYQNLNVSQHALSYDRQTLKHCCQLAPFSLDHLCMC